MLHSDPERGISCVLVGPSSKRHKGGIAQFTQTFADELSDQHSVTYHSWYNPYPSFLSKREFEDKVSQERDGKVEPRFLLGYCNPLSWFRCVLAAKKQKPNVIFLTWVHPVQAPVYLCLIVLFRLFMRARIVFVCHNVMPHESFRGARMLTRMTFQMADRLMVHGRSEEEAARDLQIGAAVTRAFLPPFGHGEVSSYDINQEEQLDPARARLLYFGHIRTYKGVDVLLRALPLVLKEFPQVTLRIVGEPFMGEGSEADTCSVASLKNLIAELEVNDSVTTDFRYVPNEEVAELFSECDLLVLPYRSATQSGPIVIAYAHGIPVVATAVGGLPDVVVEGESGYLAATCSPEDVADAILRFLRRPISSHTVREVAQQFSWEEYIRKIFLN